VHCLLCRVYRKGYCGQEESERIVKFKKRKATAQKKLENERENLVRVNDILSELERQVGPLERQSEKAKIYLKKKNELNIYLLIVYWWLMGNSIMKVYFHKSHS